MEQKRKVIAYCRVSTSAQANEEKSYGIEAQKASIQKYADEHNMEIIQTFVDVVSGVEENKPELDKILFGCDITNPPFDAVLVFKNDRISREPMQFYYVMHELSVKNIELISVDEPINNDDPFAEVIRSVILSVAKYERLNITKRTSNGRKIKALKGGYSGGKPPYGYKVVDGNLVIDENEKDLVCRMFAMRDDNMSFKFIADDLNRSGYTNRKGTEWTMTHIFYIIGNKKFYQGFYKYGGNEWVKGLHEPILEVNE